MRIDTQFSVFLINKPGVLANVTGALAKARLNILALTLVDSGEQGVLRVVCDNPEEARKVLNAASDRWTEAEVVVMELENRPGAFASAAKKLADEHVNISYAYCTGGATGGRTTAVFKVADLKKAEKVLSIPRKESDNRNMRTTPPGRG
jgi:hypothetical protein